ncbi:SDR family oxidoreductase [Sphingomonas bacterium]|uniref:SDR family oxidoreductase n=1 Tax=Sphingomonas bacterium TaxID=1895847 RepID=UPI0015750B2B|nr:SDR family oxidoreductase [Sphingomonas bacterium]
MGILRGKVAVVTGGSRGLGRHFVEALAAAGARVGCLARTSDELYAFAATYKDQVLALPCDVTSSDSVDRAIAAVIERFGQLDILINNAAIFRPFLLEEASDDEVEAHVAVNLLGPIRCTRTAIPLLRRSKGQIVFVSSESVRMPFPLLTVYAATKAGIETLAAGLRDELRDDGIRVTVLRSGSVAGTTGHIGWDPATAERFFATIRRSGHAAFTGTAADPRSMAEALLAVLGLPPDVNIDLIEARGAHPVPAAYNSPAVIEELA